MNQVMVDIETMSTSTNNALVLSCAIVPFSLKISGPEIGTPKLWVLDPREQLALGREVGLDTVTWWAKQTEEARQHWLYGEVTPLKVSLCELSLAYSNISIRRIWANGVCFDIANLESLMRATGLPVPWSYNSVRDARTIRQVLEVCRERPSSEARVTLHDPVSDCLEQIWWLWERLPDLSKT